MPVPQSPTSSGPDDPERAQNAGSRRKWRTWLRRGAWTAGTVVILAGLLVAFWLRAALYHRFVRFPREAATWQALRLQRQAVSDNAGWTEYRGILHSHSLYSHDSEVPFEEILHALKD